MTVSMRAEHDLSPVEIDSIEDRLYDHNRRAIGRDDGQGLSFVIRDEMDRIVGVAAGYSWAGTSELKQLWIDHPYRGRGYARALLNAFVTEAAARGVRRIWVASYNFQAPEMYEKAGFERVAELAGWPEGHSNIVLCKTLAAQSRTPVTVRIRESTPADGSRVLEIWRRAVDATHHFLTLTDRRDIDAEVATFLPGASLDLAVDETDRAIGFMLLDGGRMEALFVDPDIHGSGVGRALVEDAVRRHPGLSADVNEQNHQAIGFYERLGFEHLGRSAIDGQGRPYPLIHLRHARSASLPVGSPGEKRPSFPTSPNGSSI
jgi:putative acetyltransferase